MSFDNLLLPEAIPERIYAIVKMASSGKYTREELREFISPPALNNNYDDFNAAFNAAIKSNLIKQNESTGYIESSVAEDQISSIDSFRRYMAKIALADETSIFYRFTSWYMSQDGEVFFYKTSEELSSKLTGEFINIDKKKILGWRFWASFLGFGYLQGKDAIFLIPNMSLRIQDALFMDRSLELNREIRFREFVEHIKNICPEVERIIDNQKLCIGLSNGLRTLHDFGKLELIYTSDSDDVWQLYRVESHQIRSLVTGIVIKEGIYG